MASASRLCPSLRRLEYGPMSGHPTSAPTDDQPSEDGMADRRALEPIIGRGLDDDEWPANAAPWRPSG
jgi:hypothetical protein